MNILSYRIKNLKKVKVGTVLSKDNWYWSRFEVTKIRYPSFFDKVMNRKSMVEGIRLDNKNITYIAASDFQHWGVRVYV